MPVPNLDFVSCVELAFAMLFALVPSSNIHFISICPTVLALTVELVVFEGTEVFYPIWPSEPSKSVHLTFDPLPFKLFSILPDVYPVAFDATHLEVSAVGGAISEEEGSSSMFLIVLIMSGVLRSIWPTFNAFAVLLPV